jgi:hypothetical protein
MKKTLYNSYYKLGLEYFINKRFLGLHKPNAFTNLFYFALILIVLLLANIS